MRVLLSLPLIARTFKNIFTRMICYLMKRNRFEYQFACQRWMVENRLPWIFGWKSAMFSCYKILKYSTDHKIDCKIFFLSINRLIQINIKVFNISTVINVKTFQWQWSSIFFFTSWVCSLFKYRSDISFLYVFFVLLLFIYFSIFAGTTSSLRTFEFLKSRTNNKNKKNNNMKAYQTTRINQNWYDEIVVSIHVLYSAIWCFYVFSWYVNVGKWFIIVHGNYVECSHFLSIHCYFEKDHHDFILWLVMLITFIYIERIKKKNKMNMTIE